MKQLSLKQLNDKLANACKEGNIKYVLSLINRGATDFNTGLSNACLGGYKEIVEIMIRNGACIYNSGMCQACRGGHKEIIELMISKGANRWRWGLEGACLGGNVEIINMIIDKGKNDFSENGLDYDTGLIYANIGFHKHIMKLMIDKGANINSCYSILPFEMIYYLLQAGITNFGKHSIVADECKKHLLEFKNVTNELFIKDVANIIIDF